MSGYVLGAGQPWPTAPAKPMPPCSGSVNQFTAIYSSSGELVNHIKYYDGFMGQRVGAISCLAFHPYWVSATALCPPGGPQDGE